MSDTEATLDRRRQADAAPRDSLSISVVSHGHGAMLEALLEDLVRWLAPVDVIVVTLNVPEASGFDRTRWPGVQWIENPTPKGFGANHNAALLGRSSRWYAVVNPDIRIGSDVFGALLDKARQSGAALIAPAVVDPDGAPQDSARRLLTPARLIGRIGHRLTMAPGMCEMSSRPPRFDWLAGMFLLVRHDAYTAVGGFDDRFFLYCEDMDLCIRMQLAGYRIDQAQEIEVVHDARRDSHQSFKHLRWHVSSLLRAWLKPAFWRYWGRR